MVLPDDGADAAQIGIQEPEVLLRIHTLGKTCEVAYVGEHDGHITFLVVGQLDLRDALLVQITNRGKPPALPGRLPEFDSSGND